MYSITVNLKVLGLWRIKSHNTNGKQMLSVHRLSTHCCKEFGSGVPGLDNP